MVGVGVGHLFSGLFFPAANRIGQWQLGNKNERVRDHEVAGHAAHRWPSIAPALALPRGTLLAPGPLAPTGHEKCPPSAVAEQNMVGNRDCQIPGCLHSAT